MREYTFYSSKDESFLLEHTRRSGSFSMPAFHYHDRFEIYYLVSGQRNYFIRDRVYPVSRGTLVLIGSNELHKTTESDKASHERILIEFTGSYLGGFAGNIRDIELYSIFNDIHVLNLEGIDKKTIENLLFNLVQEGKSRDAGFDTAGKAIFIELLINIFRCLSRAKDTRFDHPTPLHGKLSEVARYINENYMHPLSLDDLSARFYISKFYLCRSFKDITGFSFSEYLNSIRVREASKLLLSTGSGISDIAGKVGYDSSTHFGRVFKSITGHSPLQYRKMHLP